MEDMASIYKYMFQNGDKKSKKDIYQKYLDSSDWKTISSFMKLRDSKCLDCGSTSFLEVHHLTYDNIFNEVHNLDDLVVVCRTCHKQRHDTFDYLSLYTTNQNQIIHKIEALKHTDIDFLDKMSQIKSLKEEWVDMCSKLTPIERDRLLYIKMKELGGLTDDDIVSCFECTKKGGSMEHFTTEQCLIIIEKRLHNG